MEFIAAPGLLEFFLMANKTLDKIQKSLEQYLETKRCRTNLGFKASLVWSFVYRCQVFCQCFRFGEYGAGETLTQYMLDTDRILIFVCFRPCMSDMLSIPICVLLKPPRARVGSHSRDSISSRTTNSWRSSPTRGSRNRCSLTCGSASTPSRASSSSRQRRRRRSRVQTTNLMRERR